MKRTKNKVKTVHHIFSLIYKDRCNKRKSNLRRSIRCGMNVFIKSFLIEVLIWIAIVGIISYFTNRINTILYFDAMLKHMKQCIHILAAMALGSMASSIQHAIKVYRNMKNMKF